MSNQKFDELRDELDSLNLDILNLVNKRAKLVQDIGEIKGKQRTQRFDPVRERDMLDHIISKKNGPFKNATIEHIFKEIFKEGLEVQEDDQQKELLVYRKRKAEDTVVNINGTPFGGEDTQFIFGPCAVESYEQVASVARSEEHTSELQSRFDHV